MTMLHDVLRFLVRQGPRTPVNQLRALHMLDADEQGFRTVEEYEARLSEIYGKPWHMPRTNLEANEAEQNGDPLPS